MDDLGKRALISLAKFQIALAVIIFLPAWSLTYFRGFLYWAIFGAGCLAITLYFLRRDPALVARRMKAGPGAETAPRQKLIQSVTSVALIVLYLVSVLDRRFVWSQVPIHVSLFADALVALSFLGFFWTFRANSYAAATVTVERDQPVIATGPYALVRHPMYASAILLFLATPPALGSWYGLIPAAVIIAAICWRLLDEESHLLRDLRGYQSYCRLVSARLMPGIW